MTFGDVILLAVPWGAVTEALEAAGSMKGKLLLTCVNCLKPDFTGMLAVQMAYGMGLGPHVGMRFLRS